MTTKLHIVCLDAPSPPDYGGAIEMFYKIKALHESGVKIILHYFDYKKNRNAKGLEAYCENIFSYKRKSFFQTPTFSKPHIVASRINKDLINRMNNDNAPVLLEGIHCTGLIPYLKKERKIVVRLHNDEAAYYQSLAKTEHNFFKRSYYKIESRLLQSYQKKLSNEVTYAAISQNDVTVFMQNYGLKNVFLLPPFTPWQHVTSRAGKGTYCLYHGNLGVAENEAAALWLIEHVFAHVKIPFVIAGKNPSQKLKKRTATITHIHLKPDPSESELEELIQQAHINVLPDFNNTGIKLKLLHALFCGRFCITQGSEIEESSTVAFAQTPQAYMGFLKSYMNREFTVANIEERIKTVRQFNNAVNAAALNARL